jgi:hypothetical protein
VDGKSAVGPGATLNRAAGKLVATKARGTDRGKFVKKFIPKVDSAFNADNATNAANADRVDGFNANELTRVASTLGANLGLGNTVGASGIAAPTAITVPQPGVLIATATFEADLGNGFGDASADLQFVSGATPIGPVWRHAWPLAQEFNAVTVHHAITVTPGTHTIGLQATVVTGFVNVDNPRVSLVYIPFGPTGSAAVAARRSIAGANVARGAGDR